MFNMKKPCNDCPFRKDGTMLKSLGYDRVEEIVVNVVKEDGFFPCHKTVDYSVEREGITANNKFCAGALIAIEKADATYRNVNTRLAVGFGMYKPDEMKDVDDVINPYDYLK